MLKISLQAEIRKAFNVEHIKIPARTKLGVAMPAMEFDKRYYNAEINGEPVVLHCHEKIEVPLTLQKGDIVNVAFTTCSVDGEVSQLQVVELSPVNGKTTK